MINIEDIKQNIGSYIRFGGKGIMDGLKFKRAKTGFYKIVNADDESIKLKAYKAKRGCMLPYWEYDQDYEILNVKEFKLLPVY